MRCFPCRTCCWGMAHVQHPRVQVPLQDEEFLKRYLEYCRARCSPRLTESAADLLENEYVAIRREVGLAGTQLVVCMPAGQPLSECLGGHQKQGGSVPKHCPLLSETTHAEHLPGVTTVTAAPGVPPLM